MALKQVINRWILPIMKKKLVQTVQNNLAMTAIFLLKLINFKFLIALQYNNYYI